MNVNRRGRSICDRPGQWRYIRRILYLEGLVALVCIPMTAFVTLFLLHRETYVSGSQFWTGTLTSVLLLCVALAGLLIYLGARLSNRIYGPVYRMNQVLQDAAESNRLPEEFRIRGHDEFQQLASRLNSFFEWIRKREERFSQARSQVRDLATNMQREPEDSESEEERQGLLKRILEIDDLLSETDG